MSETAYTYYKFLDRGGYGPFSRVRWHLPDANGPGKWMPTVAGRIVECQNGYHACRERDLPSWIRQELYVVELRGDILECDNKVVAREARLVRRIEAWDESTARLFVTDCAKHVLHIFEAMYPRDNRPRSAIEIARRYDRGEASSASLASARRDAADAADAAYAAYAADAAYAAADAAAYAAAADAAAAAAAAAYAAADAAYAAADAAYAAAAAAAAASRRADARLAERKWQSNRLLELIEDPNRKETPSDAG